VTDLAVTLDSPRQPPAHGVYCQTMTILFTCPGCSREYTLDDGRDDTNSPCGRATRGTARAPAEHRPEHEEVNLSTVYTPGP